MQQTLLSPFIVTMLSIGWAAGDHSTATAAEARLLALPTPPVEDLLSDLQKELLTAKSAATAKSAGRSLTDNLPANMDRVDHAYRALGIAVAKMHQKSLCFPAATFQDVEFYNGKLGPSQTFVHDHQPSAGLIEWRSDLARLFNGPGDDAGNVNGTKWCSGTLISDELFLTAGHCFDPDSESFILPKRGSPNGGTARLSEKELAPLMLVDFRFQISADNCRDFNDIDTCSVRSPDIYPIEKLVEYKYTKDSGPSVPYIDYAIVQLGRNAEGLLPGQRYKIAKIDASIQGLDRAQTLTLIQHPEGKPKKIEAGPKVQVDSSLILYKDLDTLGGSSGSGVVSQDGSVIAVHTTGGCDAVGTNHGVTLQAIRSVSPTIEKLTSAP